MNDNTNVQSGGIGFLSLLTLIFITLKLTGFITWSWVWVLAPTWIPFVLVIVILIVFFIISLIIMKLDS